MIYLEDAPDGHRVILAEQFKQGGIYYGKRIVGKIEIIRWKVVKMQSGKTFLIQLDKKRATPFTVDGFEFYPNMPLYKGAHFTIHKSSKRIESEYKKQFAPKTLMKAKLIFNKYIDTILKKRNSNEETEAVVNFLVKQGVWK